ncbi:MAG: NPCBM/NEW2 domain-containing protein [Proteobacteria bacterium]|nr:NPCBM/NEW2 domain-containing protein [Pseudomonadota bacterium]
MDHPQQPLHVGTAFLADLPEMEVRVGYGVFGKNGDSGLGQGQKVSVNNQPSPHGLALHGSENGLSHVAYVISKQYRAFDGVVGLNDTSKGYLKSSLTFRVIGDGRELWASNPITESVRSQPFHIDVSDIAKLELTVDCGGHSGAAHAVWVDPRLSGTSN